MLKVVIPVALLLAIVLIRRIPYIGGEIRVGLIISALVALLLGRVYSPIDWIQAWLYGIDRISWVMALAIFGSIYSETQIRMGTMETVVNFLRSIFGYSPKGFVSTVILALVIAGSLLGDAIAAATVIGVLVIPVMREVYLTPEQISATIVMGGCLGSIMPPISQALFLSSSLMGLESMQPVLNIGYITSLIGLMFLLPFVAFYMVRAKTLPEHLIPKKKPLEILKDGWHTFVPLVILITIVVLKTGFNVDVFSSLSPILEQMQKIPIIKGIAFDVVLAIIAVTIVSYFYTAVRKNGLDVIITGLRNVKASVTVQICAGIMIGSFYAAGQISAVQEFATQLSPHLLKIGGSVALMMVGMLTGSQTTAQTTIFSFLGPALVSIGVDPIKVTVAGGHLACAGEGFPPACLTTFVVTGLVGGILGVKVDPLRSMFYSSYLCFYFMIVGLLLLYI